MMNPPPEVHDDLTRNGDWYVGVHQAFPGWILLHFVGHQVRPGSERERLVYQTLLHFEEARTVAARILGTAEWIEQNTSEPPDPT